MLEKMKGFRMKNHSGIQMNCEENLADEVFKWSLEDVFNEELFKDKIKEVPMSFQSVQHYFQSFTAPLLEETREDMSSSMRNLCQAPALRIQELKKCRTINQHIYRMVAIYIKGKAEGDGRERYEPQKDDVFVLTKKMPSAASDLQIGGSSCILAVVTGAGDAQLGPEYRLKFRVLKPISIPEEKPMLAFFLMNIKTNNRIWRSLSGHPQIQRNLNVIKDILEMDPSGGSCSFCSAKDTNLKGESLREILEAFSLNESQKDSVLAALSARQCRGRHPIKLIWGPPGTGKTKTLSVLLWALLKMQCRTLTCAPTNVAVATVAKRLVKLVKESPCLENYSLGNILLFGNKKRMEIDVDLEEVFLDERLDRLAECFGTTSGWSQQLSSMVDFLQECLPRYEIYLENHKCKESSLLFHEFVQEQFQLKAKGFKSCMRILCTHLSRTFLSRENVRLMTKVCDLLDTFECLLNKTNASDEVLKEVFAKKKAVDDATCHRKDIKLLTTHQLIRIRNDCLHMLGSLCKFLKIPPSLNIESITQYCFRGASLILCTASSSFRLHGKDMEPLEMLIVDEAAQLKECELTIPLQLKRIRNAVLIGDECQLRAMVKSKVAEKAGFGRSLFERMTSLGQKKVLLNMQYRMHPSISSFPNANFYNRQILDGPNVKGESHNIHFLHGKMYGSYAFLNVSKGKEVFDNCSPKNIVEIAVVLQLVRSLFEASASLKRKINVGVVSPYSAQIFEIKRKLGKTYEAHGDFMVNVKSIDGFQGGEEDVIIISTVRSNHEGDVGFLCNKQRTNVALTRARHCLWIVGNGLTLSRKGSIWKEIVFDAKKRGCFFNADEDMLLSKAMTSAIIQLGQLEDLFDQNTIVFRGARWKVEFATNFTRSFARMKRIDIRKAVNEHILKLSSGWRAKKDDHARESSFRLLKVHCVQGWYVVWTVDIRMEDSKYIQVLKVCDFVTQKGLPKLVKHFNAMLERISVDYLLKCRFRLKDRNLTVPMSWEITPAAVFSEYANKTVADLSSQFGFLSV